MKRVYGLASLALIFLLAFLARTTRAQVTSATLSGFVRNSSGAPVPGVNIVVKNIETNLAQTVRSAQGGEYSFNSLPPGKYTLSTSMPGFAQHMEKGINLTVGQSAALNIGLHSGTAQETVSVSGGAKLAGATTAAISQVIGEDAVKDLPLNGRDPSSLVYLSAGVTDETISQAVFPAAFPKSNQSFATQSSASAGGGRQGSTWYLLDGVPNMDTTTLQAAPFPNADATQEFRVITNNFDARYGFSPDAVVNIGTRGGTNAFHGGVFEFVRNYDADAKLYFSPGQSDGLRRNQFGGFAGGPVVKDKLFLFGNYQGTRNSYSQLVTENTPTAAMLQGDFSAAADNPIPLHGLPGQPNPFQSIDGKPDQINPDFLSKGALALEKLIPASDPITGQVTFAQPAQKTNYNEFMGRLDYVLSNSQRMFLRVFADKLDQPGGYLPGNLLSGFPGQHGLDLNAALSYTWTISPSLVNSITAAYISYDLDSGETVLDQNGSPVCLSQFIQVNDPPGQCFINLAISSNNGNSGGSGFNVFSGQPYQTNRRDWVLGDIVTKVIGKHAVAAGADILHRHYYEFNGSPDNPSMVFNGSYTGFIQSDFLLGYSTGISQQGTAEAGSTSGWMLGLYIQDQFKLLPNFTLNAGLRWDPDLSPAIAGNRGAAFVPGTQSIRFPNAPSGLLFAGEQGIPSGLINTTYGYLEPRIGIAWAVTPRMSVRAGFGLFTAPMEDAFYNRVWDANPFGQSYSVPYSSSTPDPFDNPWSVDTATGGTSPFPPFVTPGSTLAPSSTFASALPVALPAVFARSVKLGVTESWNLSVDREFFESLALHLGYVGSESYHQAMTVDQNPGQFFAVGNSSNGNRATFPNFQEILQVQDGGTANYNSLQAGIEERLSHGFQAQSHFTWSKTFDLSFSGDPIFGTSVSDPKDPYHDHGLSALNYPFIWVSSLIYSAPRFKSDSALIRSAMDGWELSGLYKAFSGPAFSVNGGNGNNNSFFDEYQDRADLVPGVPMNVRKGGESRWLNEYMNPAAFAVNAPGTPGNAPKFNIQQPPIQDVDLALLKNFNYKERYNMEFRFEAFNALNHPSFAQPDAEAGDATFGQITAAGPVSPRVLQAALKFTF